MQQLAMIDGRIDEILGMVGFNPGSTYAEFSPGVDKAAEYGIAGLIAGGMLAKAGFFKFCSPAWPPSGSRSPSAAWSSSARSENSSGGCSGAAKPRCPEVGAAPAVGYSRPAWKSAKAWAISSRVFMTKGP